MHGLPDRAPWEAAAFDRMRRAARMVDRFPLDGTMTPEMIAQGDTNPHPQVFPVTEDLLLSEEQVHHLLSELPCPLPLEHAVLRVDEHPADPVLLEIPEQNDGMFPETKFPSAHSLPPPSSSSSRKSGSRLASPALAMSPGRWLFVSFAALTVSGGIAWLIQAPSSVAPPRRSGAAAVLAQAKALPPPGQSADKHGTSALTVEGMVIDSFDYPYGSELNAKAGGVGWGAAWAGGRTTITPGSLSPGNLVPSGSGGHVVLAASDQIFLGRAYSSETFGTPESLRLLWASLVISHTGGSSADGGDVYINFFSNTKINSVIRLTLSEQGHSLHLRAGGAKPVAIAGERGTPARIVVRIESKASGPNVFDVSMDIWVNPSKSAGLPAPELSSVAKGVVLPDSPGFALQKPRQRELGVTRIDDILLAPKATAVLP